MRPLLTVVSDPFVQVELQRRSTVVEPGSEGRAEEVIQHGAVEPLYEAVGLWPADLHSSVG